MRLSDLKSMNSYTGAYADRKYIKRCSYRKEFEIDSEIMDVVSVKLTVDADGNEVPMTSTKSGDIIYDHRIYIPFTGKDGVKYYTSTKSPLIRNLIRKLPIIKTEEGRNGDVINYHEKIDGLLVFGMADYKYGENEVPVTTLEDAEEE